MPISRGYPVLPQLQRCGNLRRQHLTDQIECKAEPVRRATALVHQRQVLVAENIVLGEVPRLRRQGIKGGALRRGTFGGAYDIPLHILCLESLY